MVNSDQVWRKKYLEYFYDFAFLRFAKNWNIYKFNYGASLGVTNEWKFNKSEEKIAKECLKSFKSISVREKVAIKMVKNHLGFKPIFVLDPTFLINKKYYLKLINNYQNKNIINKEYIFTYFFSEKKEILKFINDSATKLNYEIFRVKVYHENSVKKFLYGIYNCKAVVTNSYHGTLFSIIFRKPFVSFIYGENDERFNSLKEIFKIENRIMKYNNIPDINLLTTPLNIDQDLIESLKAKSISYLKMNIQNYKKLKKIYFDI